jgi:choline-sulfatase
MANVVVLMSDEHNPFYSSPYGHPRIHTPDMQQLVERGTIFQNAYCPSPLCMPSRSAFMAGKRVHQIQTYSNCNVNVDPSPLSFGAALTRQGIYTVYIGKTDVYAKGDDLGFSEMMFPNDRKLPGDTNHRRNPLTIRLGAAKRAERFGPSPDVGLGDIERVDRAIEWITAKAPSLDCPWVLTVGLHYPHFPHYTSQELWDMYADDEDLPEFGPKCESARHPYAQALRAHFETDQFTEEHIRGQRRGYLGCIAFVDQQLGRLMDALKAAGLFEDTNVIYTSDHGEMLGKFGMWWKCNLYEDSVRVPLLAAGPDFENEATVRTPTDLHDLQASLFRCVGAERPEDWAGKPLQEIPHDDPERVVFSEYHGHGTRGSSYMIRKGKWKYIFYIDAPAQLFDLDTDPNELQNLASKHPDVIHDLHAELTKICDPVQEHERAETFIEKQFETIESTR